MKQIHTTCGWVGHSDPAAWCNRRVKVKPTTLMKLALAAYVTQAALGALVGFTLPFLYNEQVIQWLTR